MVWLAVRPRQPSRHAPALPLGGRNSDREAGLFAGCSDAARAPRLPAAGRQLMMHAIPSEVRRATHEARVGPRLTRRPDALRGIAGKRE